MKILLLQNLLEKINKKIQILDEEFPDDCYYDLIEYSSIEFIFANNSFEYEKFSNLNIEELEILKDAKFIENDYRIYQDSEDHDFYNHKQYSIWHFPKLDIYVRFEGEYNSNDGPEFTSMFEVYPKEEMVIKFLKKDV